MDLLKWLVSGAAVAAIVWVNWYFFFAGKRATREEGAAAGSADLEIPITVKGGYDRS